MGAFVLLGVALYAALVLLTLRASVVYKNGAAIMCEQKRAWARDALVLGDKPSAAIFMGNSIMLSGLIPDTFDHELNGSVRSYNLALPTLGIGPATQMLSDLIRRGQVPAFIITPVIIDAGTGPSLFDYYGVQGLRFPRDVRALAERHDKTALWNYLVPMRMYTHEILKFLINGVLHPSDIAATRAKNDAVIRQMLADRGYYYIQEEALFPDGKLPPGYEVDPKADLRPVSPPPFDFARDPFVKRFFDLTRDHHISVLLIDFVYRDGTEPPYARRPDAVSILTSMYPNVHVTETSWQRKFLPNEDFSDEGHLNPAGAAIFTRMIAREFEAAFGKRRPEAGR